MAKLHYISNPSGYGFSTKDVLIKHYQNEILDDFEALYSIYNDSDRLCEVIRQLLEDVLSRCKNAC